MNNQSNNILPFMPDHIAIKQSLIEFYLDWINNYLTIDKMASDYNLTNEQCNTLINIGRTIS